VALAFKASRIIVIASICVLYLPNPDLPNPDTPDLCIRVLTTLPLRYGPPRSGSNGLDIWGRAMREESRRCQVSAEPKAGRRRRFSPEDKRVLVEEALGTGTSISAVARRYGLSSSLLFRWRRLVEQGELESPGADPEVAPTAEVKELQIRVRELERLLGRKTLEAEILKEALELSRSKKLLLRTSLRSTEGSK
jgi:transposase